MKRGDISHLFSIVDKIPSIYYNNSIKIKETYIYAQEDESRNLDGKYIVVRC